MNTIRSTHTARFGRRALTTTIACLSFTPFATAADCDLASIFGDPVTTDFQPGSDGTIIGSGDFDGDGLFDLALSRFPRQIGIELIFSIMQ